MVQRVGRYTILFEQPPQIESYASVVGTMENSGPLEGQFDVVSKDPLFGEQTWEKAESTMQKKAVDKALCKAKISKNDLNYIFGGDLLNQCIGSTFGLKEFEVPIVGLYGACSTMAESIGVASVFIGGKSATKVAAVTSSHFCSAERQFRFPLNYGSQRPPSAQWTVTGSGCVVLSSSSDNDNKDKGISVEGVTFGRIMDMGITDANNMGAAMAPAACDTIKNFLTDTKTKPSDYDLILTGDLGEVGSKLLKKLLKGENIDIEKNHNDCGLMIYDMEKQDVNSGGSGCGCSGSVLCSNILNRLKNKELRNILFAATGALMSPTSSQQGQSIPGISHLINLRSY